MGTVFADALQRDASQPRCCCAVGLACDLVIGMPRPPGTATDALWATVPLLTLPVQKMASRAAASFAYATAGAVREPCLWKATIRALRGSAYTRAAWQLAS